MEPSQQLLTDVKADKGGLVGCSLSVDMRVNVPKLRPGPGNYRLLPKTVCERPSNALGQTDMIIFVFT